MTFPSKNKTKPVALLTGGTSFLGREIAIQLAERGFDLALHYRNSAARARQCSQEVRGRGAKVLLLKGDLRKPDQISGLLKKTIGEFKRLDLLVNNASLFFPTSFSTARPSQWRDLFNVNLFSPFFLIQAAAPWLKKSNGGVVNLTDIYGENAGLKDYSAYSVSKAGLIALTKVLARELGPEIRVNAVSPGAIFIPKTYSRKQKRELIGRSALRRQGTPADVAKAVYFLATHPFITGQVLKVDGGRFI